MKRRHSKLHSTFTKEVVLLTSPADNVVPKQQSKQNLYQLGHVLSAVQISKDWSENQVLQNLKDFFKEKLNDTRLEIL